MTKVCVVGAWHQASVAAAGLAELGHEVTGTALDREAIKRLAGGQPPVVEPDLEGLLKRHLRSGRLRYTVDFADALADVEVVLIAIDTPVGPDDTPELEVVFESVRAVARAAAADALIVVSAQVPVGTCDRIAALLAEMRPDVRWDVAYVPEFLQLGSAVRLYLQPDRIVVGADHPGVADRVESLFAGLPAPKLRTSVRSAEMAKHASNAFLAASISFVNEVAALCEATGCDALAVAEAMRLDPRIGPRAFLSPGLGFAGGTLGRDVRSLQAIGHAAGRPTQLMDAVMEVNGRQTRLVVDRLRSTFGAFDGRTVAILGLTYKPGTSALRRSAAVEAAQELLAAGARVRAHDPMVPPNRASELPDRLELTETPENAARGAACVVLMTEWPQYRELDWPCLAAAMAGDLVVDARNGLDPAPVTAAGLRYWGVGRVAGIASELQGERP